jgi:hypothetical protein
VFRPQDAGASRPSGRRSDEGRGRLLDELRIPDQRLTDADHLRGLSDCFARGSGRSHCFRWNRRTYRLPDAIFTCQLSRLLSPLRRRLQFRQHLDGDRGELALREMAARAIERPCGRTRGATRQTGWRGGGGRGRCPKSTGVYRPGRGERTAPTRRSGVDARAWCPGSLHPLHEMHERARILFRATRASGWARCTKCTRPL